MSSVRVNQEVLLKDEILLEEGEWEVVGVITEEAVVGSEKDDLKGIISRECLREKRDIGIWVTILFTISSHFCTKYKNTHKTVCILSGWVLDLCCGIFLEGWNTEDGRFPFL
mgnify:FL=1